MGSQLIRTMNPVILRLQRCHYFTTLADISQLHLIRILVFVALYDVICIYLRRVVEMKS